MELLLGCGNRREKLIRPHGRPTNWTTLTTLDMDRRCNPDHVWNLDWSDPLPFADNTFDEIHAYEVLEHLGNQGDWWTFFHQFTDYWRILRPDGLLCATVPAHDSIWTWGDPGHRRVINLGTLVFLNQEEYHKQVGKTAMTDYRGHWFGDFSVAWAEHYPETLAFVLQAHKPARSFTLPTTTTETPTPTLT